MKKINIKNKEIHILVLFGLLALLAISVNLANKYTPQDNFISDNQFPTSAAVSINIVSPTTNEYFNATAPGFVVEIDDTVNLIDTMWYTIDGGTTNITFTVNGTIDQTEWTAHPENSVTLTFYANNSISEEDSASVTINKDSVDPSFDSIDSPSPGTWFDSTPPGYSLSITETNLDTIWYTLDTGLNNYTGALSGTIDSTAWTNAPQGAVTIMFYVNDSAGNSDSASVGVNKDSIVPSIDSIDSPIPGTWFDSTPPGYSLSITETNLDTIWYTLDAGLNNYTGALSGTIDSTAWTNAPQGAVTITFYVNDSAGNLDSASVGINKDSLNPSLDSIDSPSPGAWFDSTPPSYSLSITEVNLDTIWYTLDAGLNNYTGALSGTIDSTAWTNAPQGAVTITFYVNDSVGNWDSASVGINKDSVDPSLDSIDSPLPGTWFDNTPPSYSLSITETNLDTIWYTLDAGLNNYTGALSGSIDSTAWTNAPQGAVTITFYVNDTASNWDSMSVSVNKDSVDPSVDSIDSPSPGTWFNNAPPSYSLSITETNLDSIWYTLDGGINNYTGAVSGTIDSTAWTNAPQGAVTIVFYVNDSVGNWGSASVGINKDSVDPSLDSIDSPLPGSNHSTPPSYSLSITEVNLDSIWYTLDNGLNNYTGALSGIINSTAWSNAPQGTITIIFYVNDSAGNWDSMSVSVNKDSVDPSIDSIDSPTADAWFSIAPPSYSLSITEANLDEIWYTLDGGLNNYTGAASGTIDSTAWTNAPQGAITITFYLNDSAGNWAFDQVLINKDTIIPQINITSPGAGQTFGAQAPNFIVEIIDLTLHTMWYTFDGVTNFTFIVNGTIDFAEWTSLSNGAVTITFYANDSFGYTNSASQGFFKNANAPVINIISPTSDSYYGTIAPNFTVEISDPDLHTMWYSINGGANFTFTTNGTIDQTEWAALPFNEGVVSLVFYANDTYGNIASVLRLIYKDTVAPTINILSPTLLQLLGVNSPSFTVEIDDPILNAMWYTLDNGVTNYTFLVNSTFNTLAWGSLPNGTATIYFYAIDFVGNEAFDSVVVRVDKITPTVTINLPVDDSVLGTQPTINITVKDENVDSIWYRVGTTIIILPLSANNSDVLLNLLIWNALPEGSFTIEFFANDTAGNLNSLYSVNLIKDIAAPVVTIVHPLANATYEATPQITLTINDATLDTTWYTIVGTNYTFEFTAILGTNVVTIDQAAWNALSNGDVTIVFYANDSLGRISSDSITVNRDVPVPFDFIPFLIILMVAVIAIVVVVIILKRRKTHKTSDKEVRKIESLWD
jgi:hypothetical protein